MCCLLLNMSANVCPRVSGSPYHEVTRPRRRVTGGDAALPGGGDDDGDGGGGLWWCNISDGR